MPYPNVYKKYSGEPGLGFLVSNGIEIGVDGGHSGYTVDYGPSNFTGYYQGIPPLTGFNAYFKSDVTAPLSYVSVNNPEFSIPYFTFLFNRGTTPSGSQVIYANFVNSEYSEWSGITTPQPLQLKINQGFLPNSILANYNLPTILTSGLTQIVISNYLSCDWGLGDDFGTRTLYDLSLNQGQVGGNNLGDAPRVRGGLPTWGFDGVDANLQLTSTTTYATSNFTWLFYATFIEAVPNQAWLIASASGTEKNFIVSFLSANTTNCNMVIETNNSTYSSRTSGINYDGFSGTGPQTVSSQFVPSRGNTKGIALVKSGTTFSLYLSDTLGPNTTLKWQVTINDWNIVNSSLPTYMFYNPFVNDYTRGGMLAFQFYNKVLNDYEITKSLQRFINMYTGENTYSGF
jgi:hypothetical protein